MVWRPRGSSRPLGNSGCRGRPSRTAGLFSVAPGTRLLRGRNSRFRSALGESGAVTATQGPWRAARRGGSRADHHQLPETDPPRGGLGGARGDADGSRTRRPRWGGSGAADKVRPPEAGPPGSIELLSRASGAAGQLSRGTAAGHRRRWEVGEATGGEWCREIPGLALAIDPGVPITSAPEPWIGAASASGRESLRSRPWRPLHDLGPDRTALELGGIGGGDFAAETGQTRPRAAGRPESTNARWAPRRAQRGIASGARRRRRGRRPIRCAGGRRGRERGGGGGWGAVIAALVVLVSAGELRLPTSIVDVARAR